MEAPDLPLLDRLDTLMLRAQRFTGIPTWRYCQILGAAASVALCISILEDYHPKDVITLGLGIVALLYWILLTPSQFTQRLADLVQAPIYNDGGYSLVGFGVRWFMWIWLCVHIYIGDGWMITATGCFWLCCWLLSVNTYPNNGPSLRDRVRSWLMPARRVAVASAFAGASTS